jgi:hypothetical protein
MAYESSHVAISTEEIKAIHQGEKIFSLKPSGFLINTYAAESLFSMTGACAVNFSIGYVIYKFAGLIVVVFTDMAFQLKDIEGQSSGLISSTGIPAEYRPPTMQTRQIGYSFLTQPNVDDIGIAQLLPDGRLYVSGRSMWSLDGNTVSIPGFTFTYPDPSL